jgi:hypothetical protein
MTSASPVSEFLMKLLVLSVVCLGSCAPWGFRRPSVGRSIDSSRALSVGSFVQDHDCINVSTISIAVESIDWLPVDGRVRYYFTVSNTGSRPIWYFGLDSEMPLGAAVRSGSGWCVLTVPVSNDISEYSFHRLSPGASIRGASFFREVEDSIRVFGTFSDHDVGGIDPHCSTVLWSNQFRM